MAWKPALTTRAGEVRLSLICGVGAFGCDVIQELGQHLAILPTGPRLAIRAASCDTHAEVARVVSEAREDLIRIENTNRIEESGWRLPGTELERRVRHFFVTSLEHVGELATELQTQWDAHPADAYFLLLFGTDPDELRAIRAEAWAGAFLISGKNARGETVGEELVRSSLAGTLLFSALHPLLEPLSDNAGRGALATVGFAGVYGITGPALDRAAAELARRVVAGQLSDRLPDPGLEASREAFERFDPRALTRQLFDPTLQAEAAPQSLASGDAALHTAVPQWHGDALEVDLSEAALALELTPAGKEASWTTRIRRYVRTVDMTVMYNWRLRLEAAARRLGSKAGEDLVREIEALLRERPRAPELASRTIAWLRGRFDARYSWPETPHGDLDQALERLDAAIRDRSNPADLLVRLALWLVPAIVAGIAILGALYTGFRGVLFPALFAFGGVLAGLAWYVWRLERDRRAVSRARDAALQLIVRRQEAIVAENAVRATREFVLPRVREELETGAVPAVDAYRFRLEEARAELEQSTGEPLREPPSLRPVLSTPVEFERLLEALDASPAGSDLEDAVVAGALAPGLAEEELRSSVVDWSRSRVLERVAARQLSLIELWEIRRACRGGEDDLPSVLESLWRYATPLMEIRALKGDSPEVQLVAVPEGLGERVRGWADGAERYPLDAVEEAGDVPLLACVRAGLITPLERDGERSR